MPRILRIFVSSPGDVIRERQVAERIIASMDAELGARIDGECQLYRTAGVHLVDWMPRKKRIGVGHRHLAE